MRSGKLHPPLGWMWQVIIGSSVLLVAIGSLMGCSDPFEERIQASQQERRHEIAEIKEGLPFFVKHRMDPTWDQSKPSMLARIERLAMTDHNNVARDENLFRNKPSLVAFFFTSCPNYCPLIMRKMKALESQVGSAIGAQMIAVTLDIENDTPKVLGTFAKKFFKSTPPTNWYFLNAGSDQLKYLAHEVFAIEGFKDFTANRIVHTERIFLIDPHGFVRAVINGTQGELPQDQRSTILSYAEAWQAAANHASATVDPHHQAKGT